MPGSTSGGYTSSHSAYAGPSTSANRGGTITKRSSLVAAPVPSPTLLLPANSTEHRSWLSGWTRLDGDVMLSGYQIWAVQELVTDREALLPCICVYTGEDVDTIPVERYQLSQGATTLNDAELELWNHTRSVFKAAGARMSETVEGYLPVTSLASLSALKTPVMVEKGDYGAAVPLLHGNINLRRLGLGARSSLRIEPPPSAQLEQFRVTYKLPGSKVLQLVRVVQNALALFGLGPVSTDSVHGSYLHEGDGLLCDPTLSALALLQHHLLQPSDPQHPLPPSLLCTLFSLPLRARAYLYALNIGTAPKDPFSPALSRTEFITCLRTFTRRPNGFLTKEGVNNLAAMWRAKESGRLHGQRHKTARGMDLPTEKLEELVETVKQRGISGGSSVRRLWTGEVEQEVGFASPRQADHWGGSMNLDDADGGFSTDGGGAERVKGVLRGVKRAGRILGDTMMGQDSEREGNPRGRGRLPGLAPLETASHTASHTPVTKTSMDTPTSPADALHKTHSFASRLSLALSSDHFHPHSHPHATQLPVVRQTSLAPSPIIGDPSFPTVGTDTPRSVSLGQGMPSFSRKSSLMSSGRRAVSEQVMPATSSRSSPLIGGTVDEEDSTDAAQETRTRTTMLDGGAKRRRHSFNVRGDAEVPWVLLSRRRLELDVNMRMTAFSLHQREVQLGEMVEALRTVQATYDEALLSLEEPLSASQMRLAALQASSHSALMAPPRPSTSARLSYAQTVVEDKLADIQSFVAQCAARIGKGGDVARGVLRLGRERSGMRQLVLTLLMWRSWLESRWKSRWFRTTVEVRSEAQPVKAD